MEVKFQLAKNNEETVIVNNYFLHSSYDPSKEAQRFVDSTNISFNPEFIIVIEPALSYCVKYLRKKFPDSKIGVIRLIKEFEKYNSLFDFSINCFNQFQEIQKSLSTIFTEESLLKVSFITWNNSEKIFQKEISSITKNIQEALSNSKTLLVTRQYFEKKWLLNSINFLKYINNVCKIKGHVNKLVLIISSGPSLKSIIDIIQNNRNKFFIICLSSAISVCKYYGIIPDIYMSTDGGYWAGQHLKKIDKNVPIALPFESFTNKSNLKDFRIIPLFYKDELLADFIESEHIPYTIAKRNGTVSGTALEFALSLNNAPVYLVGIDMANQKGFQHSQPNELEINNSLFDNRIFNSEIRSIKSEFSKSSLDIYKNWFQQYPNKNKRIFRIIDKPKNNLGQIEDITSKDFMNICNEYSNEKNDYCFTSEKSEINLNALLEFIQKLKFSEKWQTHLFPLDNVSLSHNPGNIDLINKIKERNESLYNKIRNILNDK